MRAPRPDVLPSQLTGLSLLMLAPLSAETIDAGAQAYVEGRARLGALIAAGRATRAALERGHR